MDDRETSSGETCWWIDNHDGSEDVAEDEKTPCGTLTDNEAYEDNGDEIIGGREAEENLHPWIARIVGRCATGSPGLCAGALISRRHVLTSFHCTYLKKKGGDGLEGLKGPCDHSNRERIAVFGVHTFDFKKIEEYKKTGKAVPIIDIKTPRDFLLTEENYESHDFAMAILEREITFTESVRPICIPRQNEEFGGKKAIAAGWGRYKVKHESDPTKHGQSPTLREVELTVSTKRYNHHKMFGTEGRDEEGKVADACSGDSGGPLIWKSPAPRFVLIGTVKGLGFDCRSGEYAEFEGSDNGVWNKVSAHSDWIKKTMKDKDIDESMDLEVPPPEESLSEVGEVDNDKAERK